MQGDRSRQFPGSNATGGAVDTSRDETTYVPTGFFFRGIRERDPSRANILWIAICLTLCKTAWRSAACSSPQAEMPDFADIALSAFAAHVQDSFADRHAVIATLTTGFFRSRYYLKLSTLTCFRHGCNSTGWRPCSERNCEEKKARICANNKKFRRTKHLKK